jgi:hypothetical protein
MYDKDSAPTDDQVKKYKYISLMLDSALFEMRDFAKKKQDGIISETKIKILNRLLTEVRGILVFEESVSYLDPLDEGKLPQNSDAVLILGQYRAAMDSFVKRHKKTINYEETWITKEWIEAQGEDRKEPDEDNYEKQKEDE